jgi:hypothetical protein
METPPEPKVKNKHNSRDAQRANPEGISIRVQFKYDLKSD